MFRWRGGWADAAKPLSEGPVRHGGPPALGWSGPESRFEFSAPVICAGAFFWFTARAVEDANARAHRFPARRDHDRLPAVAAGEAHHADGARRRILEEPGSASAYRCRYRTRHARGYARLGAGRGLKGVIHRIVKVSKPVSKLVSKRVAQDGQNKKVIYILPCKARTKFRVQP